MIEVLNFESALGQASDLWVIPSFEGSEVASKLNWYMNFQLSQLDKQRPTTISSALSKVLASTGIEAIQSKKPKVSLVLSQNLLPCRWILLVPTEAKLEDWLKEILKAWEGLKRPSCHVFLPSGSDVKSAQQILKNEKIESAFNLVLN
jgi:hypothetical protein